MKNLFFILIFSACVLSAQAKDYIVTDYSVSMDSTQLNTAAIQSVIDLAEKEGIMFEANVFIPVSLPFQSGHLAVILGNLLDNALEACRGVPEGQRYIKLDISCY